MLISSVSCTWNPQRRGLKLNPITSLYYIAPCCFAFLLLPFLMFELPKIRNDPAVVINIPVLLSNAAAAFGALSRLSPNSTPHSQCCQLLIVATICWI